MGGGVAEKVAGLISGFLPLSVAGLLPCPTSILASETLTPASLSDRGFPEVFLSTRHVTR